MEPSNTIPILKTNLWVFAIENGRLTATGRNAAASQPKRTNIGPAGNRLELTQTLCHALPYLELWELPALLAKIDATDTNKGA